MARIDIKQAAGFLFAGAMVGAAIALLYAPQSGVRTRKDVKKFAGKTVASIGFDNAKKYVEDGRSRLEQIIKNT